MSDYSEQDEKFLAELDENLKDDSDYQSISKEEKLPIIPVMNKMLDRVWPLSIVMKIQMNPMLI